MRVDIAMAVLIGFRPLYPPRKWCKPDFAKQALAVVAAAAAAVAAATAAAEPLGTDHFCLVK